MKNTVLLAGVLGAALTFSMNNWAMGHSDDAAFDASRMVSHMADRLDLDDEQRVGIEAALAAGGEQVAQDRERLRELKKQLHAQVADFDAGTAQTLADEIGQLSSRLSYSRTAAFAEVYQLLNEEQRVEMAQWMEQRDARRSKWQRRHGSNSD